MGTFNEEHIRRDYKSELNHSHRFSFIIIEMFCQQSSIRAIKIVFRAFYLAYMVYVSVRQILVPFQMKNIVNALYVHSNSFQAVGYFKRYGTKVNSAYLLKICELCNFHSIEPDF